MNTFDDYLSTVPGEENHGKLQEVLAWIAREFPQLDTRIAWNQPMFTHHGTFIIGFSVAKNHFNIALEKAGLDHFSEEIIKAGYTHGKMLMQVKWTQDMDWELLRRMVQFNLDDKKDVTSFWRK